MWSGKGFNVTVNNQKVEMGFKKCAPLSHTSVFYLVTVILIGDCHKLNNFKDFKALNKGFCQIPEVKV